MSATYTASAKRFLRQYRASHLTATYASLTSAVEAEARLPYQWWKYITRYKSVIYPAHAETAENPADRDYFDAYLMCAEHAEGQHRVYAGMAAYRIELPDAFIGATLASLAVDISCDPYTPGGARVAIGTSAAGAALPSDTWADCREGSAHADGVAPRTTATVGSTLYWYGATATATLTPAGGLTLGKYLWVFLSLENYARARNGWTEGAARLNPSFTLVTSAAVAGYADGTNIGGGYAADSLALTVAGAAVAPQKTGSTLTSWPAVSYKFTEAHGAFRRINTATFSTAAKIAGCSRQLVAGSPGNVTTDATVITRAEALMIPSVRATTDAGWAAAQYGLAANVALTAGTPGWLFLTASYYLIPFTPPAGFTPAQITLTNGSTALNLNGATVQITPWLVPAPGDLSNATQTQWFIMQALARQAAFWLGGSATLTGTAVDGSSSPVTFTATATRLAAPAVMPDQLAASAGFTIDLDVVPSTPGFIVLAAWPADAGASLSTSLTQVGLATLKVIETGEVSGAGWLPAVTID